MTAHGTSVGNLAGCSICICISVLFLCLTLHECHVQVQTVCALSNGFSPLLLCTNVFDYTGAE